MMRWSRHFRSRSRSSSLSTRWRWQNGPWNFSDGRSTLRRRNRCKRFLAAAARTRKRGEIDKEGVDMWVLLSESGRSEDVVRRALQFDFSLSLFRLSDGRGPRVAVLKLPKGLRPDEPVGHENRGYENNLKAATENIESTHDL